MTVPEEFPPFDTADNGRIWHARVALKWFITVDLPWHLWRKRQSRL